MWLWLLLLLCWCLPARAQVTYLSSSTGDSGANSMSNLSFSVTVPSGPNLGLFVGLCTANSFGGANEVTAATFNGDPLTLVAHQGSTVGDIVHGYLFSLVNPDVGTFNIQITLQNSRRWAGGAFILSNVHQTTPVDTGVTFANADNSTTGAVSVTTATNDLVIDIGCVRGADTTWTMGTQPNRTFRFTDTGAATSPGNDAKISGSTASGTGSLLMNWTAGSTVGISILGVNVNVVPAAPAGRLSGGFLLLR
jgi:hypothetical protein